MKRTYDVNVIDDGGLLLSQRDFRVTVEGARKAACKEARKVSGYRVPKVIGLRRVDKI